MWFAGTPGGCFPSGWTAGPGELAGVSEAYLLTQLERGFRTLDFYKQMTLPAGPDR